MLKKLFKGLLITILTLVIIATLFVQWQAYKINHAPEEISYEILSQQPNGEESYITMPDGSKLRVVTAGQGKTVVLAHGFGGSIRDWNLVFNQLITEGYHVIAFEQRGHNKSSIGTEGVNSKAMASDYKTVLEHFDVKDAVLVGHSMGGFLTIRFMLDYPDVAKQRLRSALIMSSFAGDVNRDNPQNKMQIPLITGGWIQTIFKSEALGTIFQASIIGKPNKAIVQTALSNMKQQNYTPLIPILQAFVDENYYSRLKEITLPCTIMVGTADKTAPAFHSETLARDIPNAHFVKVPERGHLLPWEDPKAVCEQIKHLN
jgi:non-heme chloroperoxidase